MNIKEYPPAQIRNIAITGHNGTGKTSLTEAILFISGVTNRLGKVDDGSTVTDYDPDEIKRKISINATLACCEWLKTKINIIDTPGYADFIGEVKGSLRVVDGVIIVLNANAGVEVETEKVWGYADEYKIPRAVFVNKMDKERADFEAAVESITKSFNVRAVPVEIPIGKETNFKGIVDLFHRKAFTVENGKLKEIPIPAEMKDEVEAARDKLSETVAETNDELITKYLDGQPLTDEELIKGMHDGIKSGAYVPVLCGSSTQTIGVHGLLDLISEDMPSPVEMPEVTGENPDTKEIESRSCDPDKPLCAFVFKTIADPFAGKLSLIRVYSGTLAKDSQAYNVNKNKDEKISTLFLSNGKEHQSIGKAVAGDIVASSKLSVTVTSDTFCDRAHPIKLSPTRFPEPQIVMAIEPKSQGDDEKMSTAIHRLTEEDSTVSIRRDAETKQTLISGMGEMHLNVILDRAKTKFGAEATLKPPKIAYRETIKGRADHVQGKYKRQSGGRGQYGDAVIKMDPLPRGTGFEFVNDIHGGIIPSNYIPAVEKGIREAMEHGILAGYPVTDFRVTLFYGSYHEVDSSEMAFKIAGSLGFKKAMEQCKPTILEPVMLIDVHVPEEYMGAVIGDLNSKRGQVLGVEADGKYQIIKAQVPLGEMSRYSIDLRSIVHGKGSFTMRFSHYAEAPPDTIKKIIETSDRKPHAAEEE